MLPTETELFLELVEHFQFCSNLAYFITGVIIGISINTFIDFLIYKIKSLRKKRNTEGESK